MPTIGLTGVAQVPMVHWKDLRPGVNLDCFGKTVLIEVSIHIPRHSLHKWEENKLIDSIHTSLLTALFLGCGPVHEAFLPPQQHSVAAAAT